MRCNTCISTAEFVDFRVGSLAAVNVTTAARAIHKQAGLMSINHYDTYMATGVQGNKCVGCIWDYAGQG
jgi:hypothetical protein